MITKRLVIATLIAITSTSLFAGPPVELIKLSDLTSVARRWNHGADTPKGAPTQPTPPKPLVIGANDLPPPYAKGDSMFWTEYAGQTLAVGDLFVFVYHDKLTVRPIGAVYASSVRTALGTEVKLSEIKGVVRRVIRVVPD